MIQFNYPRILPIGENAAKRKTLRLYMYVTADALFAIIRTGRLKLSHPWKTNDITECLAQNEVNQRYEIKNSGYLCFSADCTSPAMWGYYADRGKGACLAFDFDVIEVQQDVYELLVDGMVNVDQPIYIRKVEYGETRSLSNENGNEFFSKSKEWEHEQEYRIVISLDNETVVAEEMHTGSSTLLGHYIAGLMNYLRCIIMGPKFKGDEVEVKAFLKHYYKPKRMEYINNDETFRVGVNATCLARYAGISKAILDAVKFKFNIAVLLPCSCDEYELQKRRYLIVADKKNRGVIHDYKLIDVIGRFYDEKIPFCFCNLKIDLSTGDVEEICFTKVEDDFVCIREIDGRYMIVLDYEKSHLSSIYNAFLESNKSIFELT